MNKRTERYRVPDTVNDLVQQMSEPRFYRTSKQRKQLWLLIIYYIRASHKHSADITDQTFIHFVNDFVSISRKELSRQLKRMHEAGLVSRTFVRRALTVDLREGLFAEEGDCVPKGMWLDDPMATCWYRYYLPGTECPDHINV